MIYVASSWRNPAVETMFDCLDQWALEYYNFKKDGFHWSDVMPEYRIEGVTATQAIAALDHPVAKKGYDNDMEALRRATSCVLVLPCGRSAHLELGYAVGAAKHTVVYFPTSYRQDVEPELMYSMVDLVTDDIDRCMGSLHGMEVGS